MHPSSIITSIRLLCCASAASVARDTSMEDLKISMQYINLVERGEDMTTLSPHCPRKFEYTIFCLALN